jgi:hypothetical protein
MRYCVADVRLGRVRRAYVAHANAHVERGNAEVWRGEFDFGFPHSEGALTHLVAILTCCQSLVATPPLVLLPTDLLVIDSIGEVD